MPPTHVYEQRSFASYPIAYSSENFAPPRSQKSSNISCSIPFARPTHFLGLLSSLFNYLLYHLFPWTNPLGATRQSGFVFAEFVTADTIYRLQPFLVQTRYRMHAPISIATTTNSNSTQLQSPSWQNRTHTPPVARIPHAHHNNTSLPVTTLVVVRIPTPIPPISTSITCYVSPLVIWFNPCTGCGSANGHLPGCTA